MVATMTDEQIVAELKERVAGLYRMNAELAAQVDRQGKVVDAVREMYEARILQRSFGSAFGKLYEAFTEYRQQMTQLAKGGTGQ